MGGTATVEKPRFWVPALWISWWLCRRQRERLPAGRGCCPVETGLSQDGERGSPGRSPGRNDGFDGSARTFLFRLCKIRRLSFPLLGRLLRPFPFEQLSPTLLQGLRQSPSPECSATEVQLCLRGGGVAMVCERVTYSFHDDLPEGNCNHCSSGWIWQEVQAA